MTPCNRTHRASRLCHYPVHLILAHAIRVAAVQEGHPVLHWHEQIWQKRSRRHEVPTTLQRRPRSDGVGSWVITS